MVSLSVVARMLFLITLVLRGKVAANGFPPGNAGLPPSMQQERCH